MMEQTIKPIRDNVLIKSLKNNEQTKGGLFLPTSLLERSSKGIVMAVGNGTKNKKMTLKEGMVIHHIKGAGTQIEQNDETYFLMKEQDILAILPN